jgi:hypothetical protein
VKKTEQGRGERSGKEKEEESPESTDILCYKTFHIFQSSHDDERSREGVKNEGTIKLVKNRKEGETQTML